MLKIEVNVFLDNFTGELNHLFDIPLLCLVIFIRYLRQTESLFLSCWASCSDPTGQASLRPTIARFLAIADKIRFL